MELFTMFSKARILDGVNKALYVNDDECTKVDIIKRFVFVLKNAIGTDAIAIRLFEGADFPFYTTVGFSDTFVEAEKYLCPYSVRGKDPSQWPEGTCLECTCGAVASGKVVSGIGGNTASGSFWTSDASGEASNLTKEEMAGFRGKCLDNGYESICISPIRWNNGIIGILQINDKRKGVFDGDSASFIEGICGCLGDVLGPLIAKDMEEAEKERVFLENMLSISRDLRERIERL
jgi:hypothetical protein